MSAPEDEFENRELTEREKEVLRLVAMGLSNKEIAHKLVISPNTVKVHLKNIFAKIDVVSRTEATVYAIREGLVQVGGGAAEQKSEGAGESIQAPPPLSPLAPSHPYVPAPELRRRGWLSASIAAAAAMAVTVFAAGLLLLWRQGPGSQVTNPGVASIAVAASPSPTPASRWRLQASMPTARAGLAVAAYEGKVYAIGGETGAGPTDVVERYDPQTDSWIALSPKPIPVADIGAAIIGGRIYVPGGRLSSGMVTSTLEVYDPARDAWERRASLPVALSAYALAAFEGRLYVFGGWDGARYVASVYEYDPARDSWTARTPMPTARGYAGAVVAGGKVYVIGGYDGAQALAVNEEYNPGRDDGQGVAWVKRTGMPAGRYGAGVTAIADIIHIVGGEGNDARLAPLKYFAQKDEWQAFEMPSVEVGSRLGLVGVATHIYALGGYVGDKPTGQQQAYQAIYTIVLPLAR